MDKIAEMPYLWYSQESVEFLRSKATDFEKVALNLPKATNEDIINSYKSTFNFLAGVRPDAKENKNRSEST